MFARSNVRTVQWLAPGLLCAIVLSVAIARSDQALVDVKLDECKLRLAFADEFDILSIDPRDGRNAKWTAHTPWNGDFGDAVFADPGPDSPFSIEDGVLSITASRDENGKWRSGLISAADPETRGFAQRFGYFEARMKLPRGPGLWSAFWLGTNEPRDRKEPSVEVDVIEHYGHAPAAFSSVLHVWSKNPVSSAATPFETAVPAGSLYDAFHLFGVKVSPDFITFYLDRSATWQVATPKEHLMPLFPIVNLAMGAGFPIDKTPNPSILLVDYVRVFEFVDTNGTAACL